MTPNIRVRYIGDRYMPMRVQIYINGQQVNPHDYLFGASSVQAMTKAEADVITGNTAPVVDDNTGKVITGFVIVGSMVNGLIGEKYEVVEDSTEKVKPRRKRKNQED